MLSIFCHHFFKTQYNLFQPKRRQKLLQRVSLGLYDWVILRHALMDSLVRDVGQKRQVILLGAGYDSRSLRLKEHVNNKIIEIDFPATQQSKKNKLEKAGFSTDKIHFLEADFINQSLPDILSDLDKFNLKDQKVLIIWEGVTMYITEEIVANTIRSVKNYFGPGTIMVADYWRSSQNSMAKATFERLTSSVMKAFFKEPLLFSTNAQIFSEIATRNGALKVKCYNGADICEKLNLGKKYRSFAFSELAVMEF